MPPPAPPQDVASKRKRINNRLAKLRQRQHDAGPEVWPSHPEEERKLQEAILNTDNFAGGDNPGEVIDAEIKKVHPTTNRAVSWASLLNSNASSRIRQKSQDTQSNARLGSSESEPDLELLPSNSDLRGNLRTGRLGTKGFYRDTGRDSICTDNADTGASPKSYEDRSPNSKATKVRRGSRRVQEHCGNLKENICIGKSQVFCRYRPFEGKTYQQNCSDDGWEAAAGESCLHLESKSFSNVLQPQILTVNDRERTRTTFAPLLRLKPKQQAQDFHNRAQLQANSHRPALLPCPFPLKQQHRGMKVSTLSHLKDPSEKPQCLVCTEDLDFTDTSFDGCECGFNICLFCYHKIAQESGRCPGCRGVYKQDVTAKPVCLLPR